MLRAMGTVAFQSMWPILARREKEQAKTKSAEKSEERDELPRKRPGLLSSCHAHAPWSPVVERQWPDFFDPAAEPAAREKLAGGEVPADP